MASAFTVYLELGFRHIADLAGYDHILFVVALAAGYRFSQWKHLLVLVTAFTVGHSVTLALATLELVRVRGDWVEFLIPLTILLTALYTLWESWRLPGSDAAGGPVPQAGTPRAVRPEESGDAAPSRAQGDSGGTPAARLRHAREFKYGMALLFGLIHGMGFSNFLRALLGEEESLAWPLFSFNVGLEVGQVVILASILLVTSAATGLLRVPPVFWTRLLSVGAGVPALLLLISRVPG